MITKSDKLHCDKWGCAATSIPRFSLFVHLAPPNVHHSVTLRLPSNQKKLPPLFVQRYSRPGEIFPPGSGIYGLSENSLIDVVHCAYYWNLRSILQEVWAGIFVLVDDERTTSRPSKSILLDCVTPFRHWTARRFAMFRLRQDTFGKVVSVSSKLLQNSHSVMTGCFFHWSPRTWSLNALIICAMIYDQSVKSFRDSTSPK